MELDESCGKVAKLRIYERSPEKTEWIGPFSLLCLRIETEGKLGLALPKYAEIVFSSIEEALPRKLRGFCETGYHLVECAKENPSRYCFSLPSFGHDHVELYSEQLRPELAKKYISQIISKISGEFPDAIIEGSELLN